MKSVEYSKMALKMCGNAAKEKSMKRTKLIGFIAVLAIMAVAAVTFTACDGDGGGSGNTGHQQTGAAVSAPTLNSKNSNSITVNAAEFTAGNPGGQTIEYGINTANTAPTSWQDGVTFTGLNAYTTYYIFARSKENETHNAGQPSAGLSVTTDSEFVPDYNIGDTGPGGGIIFYVADGQADRPLGFTVEGYTGTTGSFASYTAHYLEAAPEDSGTAQWGANGILIPGVTTFTSSSHADYNKIGNGRKDTLTIAAYLTGAYLETGIAAQIASAATFGSQNDWFMPSSGELNLLYQQRNLAGIGITSGWFWSSSQYNANYAWGQNFDSGFRGSNNSKNYGLNVRAVRAF